VTATDRPRLRTAAIVWGLVLAALGAGAAWLALDPHLISAIGLRVLEARPADIAIGLVGALLAVGVVIVVGSTLSVVHRAQDRAHERRAVPDAAAPEGEPAAR
jgi:hypothetical protein